jgi:hypothetical protein
MTLLSQVPIAILSADRSMTLFSKSFSFQIAATFEAIDNRQLRGLLLRAP